MSRPVPVVRLVLRGDYRGDYRYRDLTMNNFLLLLFFLGIILPFDEGVVVFVGFLGGGIKWINHLIPLAELL